MRITLMPIDSRNKAVCERLSVSEGQMRFIAGNADSIKEAESNPDVARPFAVYADDKPVGFAMFAFDEGNEDPEDKYWLWRFMIDKNEQGKGYGRAALAEIIRYFREHGADIITLSTKAENTAALHLYHQFGFKENGQMNDGEAVLKLIL